jgi:hypothetical protein
MRRLATTCLLLALAGCGEKTTHPSPSPAPGAAAPEATGRSTVLAPHLTVPRLLEIDRIGEQMGTNDRVTYGVDGSAIKVKAYGGGGYGAWRCRLAPADLRELRRSVARLPLDPAPRHAAAKRPSYYSPPPAQFVIRGRGSYVDSFTEDAQPRDARPLVRLMTRLLAGQGVRCRQTFTQRKR